MQGTGVTNVDGKNYIQRTQIFPLEVSITQNGQLVRTTLQLPGVANFLLKALTRETLVNGVPSVKRFRFLLGNTDGAVNYMAAGIGGTTDRVLDSLCFGSAQFPFPLIPPILYGANAAIRLEFEDVSLAQPYTIVCAFHGSYLIETA